VPFLAREFGGKEGSDEFACDGDANDSRTENEDVHMIVLDPLVRGIRVSHIPGPDSNNLVGRNRSSDPTAANQDASVSFASNNGQPDLKSEVGIVRRLAIESSEIGNRMPEGSNLLDEDGFEIKARMVGSECDLQINLFFGADDRIRTRDLVFTKHLLYP
jgi:hypothetical protein